MAIAIDNSQRKILYPKSLEKLLPSAIVLELSKLSDSALVIEEIRLRKNAPCSLSTNRGNILLECALTQREMNETLAAMSGYSLYAHSDTINSGYITLEGGIRVGICGRASIVGSRVNGVYDISALNIRLPQRISSVGEPVCRLLRTMRDRRGVLVYSPPGVGKTTLLRSVAYKMASGSRAWRVSIIDTRGELAINDCELGATVDVLSGYPKALGIEIAARTMNPELMVCDEIGDLSEASSIIGAQNCGVPLLASAHGENISGLLKRSGIRALHDASVFGAYVRIERTASSIDYKYTVHTAKEADFYI